MKECVNCFDFYVCGEMHKDPSHCRYFCERDEQRFIISDKLCFCPGNCVNDYETGYIHALEKTNSPVVYAYWMVTTDIDLDGSDMTVDQIWHCSNCQSPYHRKFRWYGSKRYTSGQNFCPECGATMLGFKVAQND